MLKKIRKFFDPKAPFDGMSTKGEALSEFVSSPGTIIKYLILFSVVFSFGCFLNGICKRMRKFGRG